MKKRIFLLTFFLMLGICLQSCSSSRPIPGHSRMTTYEVRQAQRGNSLYVRYHGEMIKRPKVTFPGK
jgi:hypothetical protein